MEDKTKDENVLLNEESEETAESNLDAVQDILDEQTAQFNEDEFKEQFLQLKLEKEEFNNKYLRLNADFMNYKKRVEKEKTDIYNYANEKLILELLPIIDNLERAVSSAKVEESSGSLLKGIEMVQQQFLDILAKNGVKEISAIGEEFNHNYHHAVLQEDHPDYESNKVIEVLQKGYTLNDKVIRPSMVKVSN